MSTDLEITVTSTPAVIDTNYEALKARINEEMERYDIVVTEDTVKDAKKSMADLNKLKGKLAARRKEEIATASEPVKAFDQKFRELEEICETARQRISEQAKKFEAETLVKAQALIDAEIQAQYGELEIRNEFRNASVTALLTHLTPKGALSSVGRKAVTAEVSECQAAQSRCDLREANLEVACHRAGLRVPLTPVYLSGFIDVKSDAEYDRLLTQLIEKEVARQRQGDEKREREQEQAREKERLAEQREEEHRAKEAEQLEAEKAPKAEVDQAAGYGKAVEEFKPGSQEPTEPPHGMTVTDEEQAQQYHYAFDDDAMPKVDQSSVDEYIKGSFERLGVTSGKIHIVCTLETVRPDDMTDEEIIEYTRNRLYNDAEITTLKHIEVRSA